MAEGFIISPDAVRERSAYQEAAPHWADATSPMTNIAAIVPAQTERDFFTTITPLFEERTFNRLNKATKRQ
jgi:hypothetical protein